MSTEEATETERALWELLVEIDIAFDRFRPRVEPFEVFVHSKVRERHRYLKSEGPSLKKIKPVPGSHGQ